jgi:hypothetical protein
MTEKSETTRWWENYLPRYLMPSIAGVVIVNWLCSYAGDGFRSLLALPTGGKPLDSTSLILLLLYGNLFCYVASYPALVFHATRVMDLPEGKWPASVLDGYLLTVLVVACVFFFHLVPPGCRYWPAFVTASLVAVVQFGRLGTVFFHRFSVKEHVDQVSRAYFYAYTLAKRRGIPETQTEEEDEEGNNITSKNLWRREFMDTYRHLREHGNSALIFLLELALAAIVYCVITKPGQTATYQLGAIGLLLAVWALPSVFVHLLAQHLERRFSRYDMRLRRDVKSPAAPEYNVSRLAEK